MSSAQNPISSSPTSAGIRKRSRYTFKQLSQLSQYSTTSPLRVIAHIDLDAFYAQCEMVRLGVPEDQPLAVQQWQGLIAINYPARAFGLGRHVDITEAKRLCPQLITQHVATWREGDDKWAYREDSSKHIASDKVSLDPYRLQSRKILATIKETLPQAPLQRVEKASIDEVFLDLSAQIHSILLQRYPELVGPPPYDDPTENLPIPPTTALDWQADALVDLDADETEDEDPDWDDIAILIGSEIVRDVRKAIRDQLQYTCSAGIARNKVLAKLGSGHKKPNQQTIIRNRAVQQFLSGFKFTKIRNLGGKLGDHIVATFGTDSLVDLLPYSLEQLKLKLGDETGSWLYGIIRGEDTSEVNSRTQIKSMLSAKSFRPSINTYDQAVKWLRIFVADIYARLVEEGVLENKRRPRTMNLHHRQGGNTRSKQIPIPTGKKIDEPMFLDLAKTLLGQVLGEGRAWPCANLSLSVSGFEDGISGNRGIGSFLVRVDEVKAVNANITTDQIDETIEPPSKRQKAGGESGIQRFFTKRENTEEHDEDFGAGKDAPHVTDETGTALASEQEGEILPSDSKHTEDTSGLPGKVSRLHQEPITTYFCQSCQTSIPEHEREEHQDWHFAKDLQAEEGHRESVSHTRPNSRNDLSKGKGGSTSLRGSRKQQPERGQKRLAFG